MKFIHEAEDFVVFFQKIYKNMSIDEIRRINLRFKFNNNSNFVKTFYNKSPYKKEN